MLALMKTFFFVGRMIEAWFMLWIHLSKGEGDAISCRLLLPLCSLAKIGVGRALMCVVLGVEMGGRMAQGVSSSSIWF